MPAQRLKVAYLQLDLLCSCPVTHSEEILTTGKSHGLNPDRNYSMLIINLVFMSVDRSSRAQWYVFSFTGWGLGQIDYLHFRRVETDRRTSHNCGDTCLQWNSCPFKTELIDFEINVLPVQYSG